MTWSTRSADSPGTLAANAVMRSYRGPEGASCTVAGSASFEVRAATTPAVSKLRRPRPFPADPPLLRDTVFSFTVKPGPTGNRNPLTVEARAVLRAQLPGQGVKAKSRTVPLRAEDVMEDRRRPGACGVTTLICPPHVQTWSKGAEVSVFDEPGGAQRCI